ncbi:MAG: Mur ligase family protein [Dehalococcoidia bacterium]|nr:bifunctional folylpolyglutamate synthase/dihydrofolate synthase [Dehalococcoidia bacterium]
MNYAEALEFLASFNDMERGIQKSANPVMNLEGMRSLLARLNDPQAGRKTVHVTGSKGKGTTASMIESMIRHGGYTTALFTSPHLHSYNERIQIGGDPVSNEEFAAGIEAIRPAVEAEADRGTSPVSTFGVLTALFFWLVRAQARPVEWQVVEVGLGGSFDVTNVLGPPEVAVITPISLEHTQILGGTPAEIAADKAGIVKEGSVCVLARQDDPDVVDVVTARCEEVGATLVNVGESYASAVVEKHVYGQAFTVEHSGVTRELRTPMLGLAPIENATTAIAAIDAAIAGGADIPEPAIANGLARCRVRGRLEVMGRAPLIVADGAHNGASAGVLAESLRTYFDWKRCFFVIGVTGDKDPRSIGMKLASLADLIVCTRFNNPRAMDPYQLIQEVGFLGAPAVAEESVAEAMDTVLGHADAADMICVTGSLYVVAEAREYVLGEGIGS